MRFHVLGFRKIHQSFLVEAGAGAQIPRVFVITSKVFTMFARTMSEQQDGDGDGRPKGRNRQSPLSELAERLAIRLRNSDYEPTKAEFEAVSKCKNEVLVNTIKYPLFFGVVAGGVSYRMQVLARAFSIAVASALGLEFGRQKAEYACIKHFMALEGSPIKSVLVDILQKDFPDHPLLREVALSRSSYVEGDEASEHNFLSEGKERGFSELNTIVDSPPQYGPDDREGQGGGRSRNVMNRREVRIGRRQAPDARDSDNSDAMGGAADILVDPFSLGLWTDVDDTGDANKENQGTSRRELRRSRMTSEQKREHNRRLREQRERGQQHRQANGM